MTARDGSIAILGVLGLSFLMYIGATGSRIEKIQGIELFGVAVACTGGVALFVWMFASCMRNRNVKRKGAWIIGFLIGTYLTAVIYYLAVERRGRLRK